MKSKRAIILALALSLAPACGEAVADPNDGPQGDQPPTGDAPIVDWTDSSKVLELGDGWTVAACEGDAPLLCVSKDGVAQGGVEAASYDLDSIPDIDPEDDVDTQLRALAEGFMQAIGTDRAEGCGPDYVFEPIEPTPFVLANLPGMVYGFVGTMPDGRPSELNLQYATVIDAQIVTVAAIAYDEGGCPGRDDLGGFTTESLVSFRPYLEEVFHESPLPSLTD